MKKFERSLELKDVVVISMSAMLGSGIFVLPGLAVAMTGASAWLAYLLAAICVLPAALSKSELATAMPTSGGTYVYLERTFGPFIGTVAGFGLMLSLLLKSAFALYGFGVYLSILTSIPLIPTALTLLLCITLLNIFGVGKVSLILRIILIISVVTLISLSFFASFQMDYSYFKPFLYFKSKGLLSATALVFVSYAGVTKVAAIAEEIKDPNKNLPRGILLSLGIVTLIYCGVVFIMVGNFQYIQLANNLKPVYLLAHKIGGSFLGSIISVIGILAMVSMANAGVLAASRFPFAMGRDRLLPSFLGKIDSKYLTPIWSILFSSLIVAGCLVLLDISKIAKLASAFMIIIYMCENFAVIVLRETRVQWYQPVYKSPFYPYVQIFGIVSGLTLIMAMGALSIEGILGIGIPSALIYIFYGRSRTSRRGVVGFRGKRFDLVDDKTVDSFKAYCKLEQFRVAKDAKVVVPLFGMEKSPEMLIEMGLALADKENIEVTHLTEVPEQTDLDDLHTESAFVRSLRRRVRAMAEQTKTSISFDPVVSYDIYKTVYDIGQRLHCQWLVVEWRGYTRGAFTIHDPMGWIKSHLDCHLLTYRDRGVRFIKKIMVFVNIDSLSNLIVSTADQLAKVNNAELMLVAFLANDSSSTVITAKMEMLNKLGEECDASTGVHILQGEKEIKTIINATDEYDLLVFGAQRNETKYMRFFGSQSDRLMSKVACSAIRVCPRL